MIIKLFEIRDRNTLVPAMAIQVSATDGYLMRRAGFGDSMVYLVALVTAKANYDPFSWGDRTMSVAHQYIEANWNKLESGAVVDVEFILGETSAPKVSEEVLG